MQFASTVLSPARRTLAFCFLIGMLAPAGAAPTPVPGGANGVSAVSGTVGSTVFNGMLRVKITALRAAAANEIPDTNPTADQKVMYFESLLSNGTHDDFTDLVTYTLADKDGISVQIPTNALKHANLHILQGASERQSEAFPVDKDFVPTKLIVQCATCGAHTAFRAIRFTIPAQ
jgi:hypothetical protein